MKKMTQGHWDHCRHHQQCHIGSLLGGVEDGLSERQVGWHGAGVAHYGSLGLLGTHGALNHHDHSIPHFFIFFVIQILRAKLLLCYMLQWMHSYDTSHAARYCPEILQGLWRGWLGMFRLAQVMWSLLQLPGWQER